MPSLAQQSRSKAAADSTTPTTAGPPSDPSQLTAESLRVLHRFLSFADPDSADQLPLQRDADDDPSADHFARHAAREVAIADWTVLYSSAPPSTSAATSNGSASTQQPFVPTLTVRAHPDPNRNLYSVQSTIPGVSARQFWSLMATAENRRLWDSTVEEGSVHRWLAQELDSRSDGTRAGPDDSDDGEAARPRDIAEATAARVELFRFGSIFMVAKARDMVLLSVDARLPPADGAPPSAEAPLRLVSTSCCTVDPSLPPRKGYTRFPLQVGGFMVEDLGDDGLSDLPDDPSVEQRMRHAAPPNGRQLRALGRRRPSASSASSGPAKAGHAAEGSTAPGFHRRRDPRGSAVLITQVSDLGEMAAWVPASVVKMVASTLVPRSIASIGKVAKTMQVHRALYDAAAEESHGGSSSTSLPSWTSRDKLAGGGEWYARRRLPAMIGTGCLCRPMTIEVGPGKTAAPAAPAAAASQKTVAETAQAAVEAADSSPGPEPEPQSALGLDLSAQAVCASPVPPPEPIAKEGILRPPPIVAELATPPPRVSSLPGTPSGTATAGALPTSPLRSPPAPTSPSKPKPGLSIDLLGLNPLPFRPSDAISPYIPGRSPGMSSGMSPGMYSDSDAGLDDMMSSISALSTPGRLGAKSGRRFDPAFSISPSDGGTETVPGSVAASELEEFGMGDYLSKGRRARDLNLNLQLSRQLYGLNNEQLSRSALILTPSSPGREEDEPIEELQADETFVPSEGGPSVSGGGGFGGGYGHIHSTPRREAGEPLPFVGSFSPSGSYRERALSLSPAARRANLLSQELLAAETRSAADQQGAKELDRRLRRMSRALVAEVEKRNRRQRSGSGHCSSSSESHPAGYATSKPRREASGESQRTEPKEDVIDLLAEALSQSLPMAHILEETGRADGTDEGLDRAANKGKSRGRDARRQQERVVLETARSVSAMLLAGSDAFAMALAPAARESLALGFDGLSTASEASEPRTPGLEDERSPTSSIVEAKSSVKAKRFPIGLGSRPGEPSSASYASGALPLRTRKPSVNSTARSISVSNAFAQPEIVTTVTHAVSRSYIFGTASVISSNGRGSDLASDAAAGTSTSSLTPPSGHSTGASTNTMATSRSGVSEERLAVEKLKALKAKHLPTRRSVHHQRVASRPGGSIVHRKSNSGLRPGAYAMMSGLIGFAWPGRGAVAAAADADANTSSAAAAPSVAEGVPARGAAAKLGHSQPQAVPGKPPTAVRASILSTSAASSHSSVPGRPRIPAKGSVGRLKSRQNYRLDLNSKLHPFPGSDSLGRAHGRKLPPIHASDEQARRAQQIMARSSRCGVQDEEDEEEEEEGADEGWVEEDDECAAAAAAAAGSAAAAVGRDPAKKVPAPSGPAGVRAVAPAQPSARGWLGAYWPSAAATDTSAASHSQTLAATSGTGVVA
ncbi:uncharacterized protein PSFLO_04450 [Pseudozyma flocculosa]|uniref:START domain-containing protein n=1 Tax=Pseudozyma flocculosa TaxID=84751 RepID=A0A5C3F6T0_9BASI|nr:uncharacterized protein PSFLO_04450 [Pseudozyma flocculosa]